MISIGKPHIMHNNSDSIQS